MNNGNDQTNLLRAIKISQIVLGAIAIVLSLVIIINPGIGIATLIILLSLILLVSGIERIAVGIHPHYTKSSRIGNIILGAISIGLGITVIVFPAFATIFLVTLLAIGLFFLGLARIIQGATNTIISKWSRAFLIGTGILSLVISSVVFAYPIAGIILLTVLLAISLLIIGIESIIHGTAAGKNISSSSHSYDVYGR